jgi:hypothetical protein
MKKNIEITAGNKIRIKRNLFAAINAAKSELEKIQIDICFFSLHGAPKEQIQQLIEKKENLEASLKNLQNFNTGLNSVGRK